MNSLRITNIIMSILKPLCVKKIYSKKISQLLTKSKFLTKNNQSFPTNKYEEIKKLEEIRYCLISGPARKTVFKESDLK